LLYRAAKDGLRGATNAAKLFQKKPATGDAARLERPAPPPLFDLTPTDEQQMIQDTMRRFADEVLRPAAEAADEAGQRNRRRPSYGRNSGFAKIAQSAHRVALWILISFESERFGGPPGRDGCCSSHSLSRR
jgi:hypothetical protein